MANPQFVGGAGVSFGIEKFEEMRSNRQRAAAGQGNGDEGLGCQESLGLKPNAGESRGQTRGGAGGVRGGPGADEPKVTPDQSWSPRADACQFACPLWIGAEGRPERRRDGARRRDLADLDVRQQPIPIGRAGIEEEFEE